MILPYVQRTWSITALLCCCIGLFGLYFPLSVEAQSALESPFGNYYNHSSLSTPDAIPRSKIGYAIEERHDFTNAGKFIVVGQSGSPTVQKGEIVQILQDGTFETAWQVSPSTNQTVTLKDIKQTSDNGFIMIGTTTMAPIGRIESDILILKTNSSMVLQWTNIIHGDLGPPQSHSLAEGNALDIFTEKDGKFNVEYAVLTGSLTHNLPHDPFGQPIGCVPHLFIAKVNVATGVLSFNNLYTIPYGSIAPITKGYDVKYVPSTSSLGKGFIAVGYCYLGRSEAYVVRTDLTGAVQWVRRIHTPATAISWVDPVAYSVVYDPTDNSDVITGTVTTTATVMNAFHGTDVFITKLNDNNGTVSWSRIIGTNVWDEEGYSITRYDMNGDCVNDSYVVSGYINDDGAGDKRFRDAYLVTVKPNGDLVSSRQMGVGGSYLNDETGYSVIQSSKGRLAIAGADDTHDGSIPSSLLIYNITNDGVACDARDIGEVLNNKGWMYSDEFIAVEGPAEQSFALDFTTQTMEGISLCADCHPYNSRFQAHYNTKYDQGYAGVPCSDGSGYIAVGITSSDPTYRDIFLLKTDKYGTQLWSRDIEVQGKEYLEYGYDIKEDHNSTDDGFIIAGAFNNNEGSLDSSALLVKVSTTGTVQWMQRYGPGSMAADARSVEVLKDASNGPEGYVFCGSIKGNGGSDVYIVRTNPTGDLQWGGTFDAQTSGVSRSDCGRAVCIDDANHNGKNEVGEDVVVAGYTMLDDYKDTDVLVMKTTSPASGSPSVIASRIYGHALSQDSAFGIKQTSDGGFIVVGSTTYHTTSCSGSSAGTRMYILKLKNDLSLEWSKIYSRAGSAYDCARSVTETKDGGFAIVGYTAYSSANLQGILLKINKQGAAEWVRSFPDDPNSGGKERVESIVETPAGALLMVGTTYSDIKVKGSTCVYNAAEGDLYMIVADCNGDGCMMKHEDLDRGQLSTSATIDIVYHNDLTYKELTPTSPTLSTCGSIMCVDRIASPVPPKMHGVYSEESPEISPFSTVELLSDNVLYYPNPVIAGEPLHILYTMPGSRSAPATITICDVLGKEVYRAERKSTAGRNEYVLNTRGVLVSGVYIIKISSGNIVISRAIVVRE